MRWSRCRDPPGYAVVDVETTGLSPSYHHEVVEIAVLLAAETVEAHVATFDGRLASSAANLGLTVRS
jgi:DNA polymerase III alpha subunit (gram-positive type)